jgi:hypothetical protein
MGKEPPITVVVVGRNSPVLKQALQSVAFQDYQDYNVVLLDDNSDGQSQNIALAKRVLGRRFFCAFTSDKRIGKVALYKKMLPSISPWRFIVNVDADDYFTRRDALSVVAGCVSRGAWFVFGRHRNLEGWSSTPPDGEARIRDILTLRRSITLWFDHPHCAYSCILSAIPDEALMCDGQYPRASQDRFLFQQAMELSGPEHSSCTGQVIYEWRFPTAHNTFFQDSGAVLARAAEVFTSRAKLKCLDEGYVLEKLKRDK